MRFLDSIENSFDKLSLLLKFELFLIPLVVFFIIIYERKDQKRFYQSNTLNATQPMMTKNIVDILNAIQEYLDKNKIKILELSNKDKQIKLSVKVDKTKLIKLLRFLEHYNSFSKIVSIEKSVDIVTIFISFDTFYVKKKTKTQSIAKLENQTIDINRFKLKAIVDQKVLINDKWLKKGELIEGFFISDIKHNSINLQNDFTSLKVELFDENSL